VSIKFADIEGNEASAQVNIEVLCDIDCSEEVVAETVLQCECPSNEELIEVNFDYYHWGEEIQKCCYPNAANANLKEKKARDGVEEEEEKLTVSINQIGQTGLIEIVWSKPVVNLKNFTDLGEDQFKVQLVQNSDE
jgi:hypothetical protein